MPFGVPSFGFSGNNQQDYGSPKNYLTSPVYQPMPAVGTPSFGFRPMTPKESSRHSSYSAKDVEPTIQTIQPSVERVRRHREYYLEGGDIYFLVENYLFRVHRYFFDRESPVFRKQFADIALNGHHRVGASDNEPLVLHDVRTDDFSRFLWVFYNPIYSIYDATTEDWAAILGLAHHWQFSEVKLLVVRELEKQIIPSIYKIVIYHRYNVDRGLLLPSYMDLVSREETLSIEEAKDLGLETSLMIMTAREIVRKGEAPASTVNVSTEELKNVIRQIFRFPGPRSDSPLSDITAAEPAMEHRSPPLLAEKRDLPTVPEHESEPVTFTASASLNSPLPPVTIPVSEPVPITPTPTPPASSVSKKQTKQTPVTPKKEVTPPAPISPPKEEPKPKEEQTKPTPLSTQKDAPKPNAQELAKPATEESSKPEAQENKKKPLLSRLSDVSKAAGSPTPVKDAATPKDKEGDKPTDTKEAKGAKGTTDEKDASGPPAPQDSNETPNETPIGTPLVDVDGRGTPSTGQSVSAKKAKTLLALAGKARKTRVAEETGLSSNKDKETDLDKETGLSSSSKRKNEEMLKESPRVPSTTNPTAFSAGSEPREPGSGTKEVETKAGLNGEGKEKVTGSKKGEGKAAGKVKTENHGDEKKVDVERDAKKPGGGAVGSSDKTTPAVTTVETTKPVTNDVKVIPATPATNDANGQEVPSAVVAAAPGLDTTTKDEKDDTTKEEVDPTIKDKAVPTVDEKTGKPEGSGEKVELIVTDEGDIATPRRATKELPTSPAKHLKEKVVPTLGLTVPETPKSDSDPLSVTTVTGSSLSPLQKMLEDTEDETLMERMARLSVVDPNYQPPKDVAPAHTDLESEFECETAPSGPGTPRSRSRSERGSFNLMLRSEVPLSDDDDFFLDCSSNASVSNFDGV